MSLKFNRICTICARGGSKGVKNKNIRDFFGKPLIAHVIEIAKSAEIFDVFAVSSDSDEILAIAKKWGVDFCIKRPIEMASDTAAKLPAIQHCVTTVQDKMGVKFNTMVDLSVTSPLMQPDDIIGAVNLLELSDCINVITASRAASSPYFSMVERQHDNYVKLVKKLDKGFDRRQDCPPCYDMNGAIYAWSGDNFFNINEVITDKTKLYEMPIERSVDIDTEFDFEMASYLYSKK